MSFTGECLTINKKATLIVSKSNIKTATVNLSKTYFLQSHVSTGSSNAWPPEFVLTTGGDAMGGRIAREMHQTKATVEQIKQSIIAQNGSLIISNK